MAVTILHKYRLLIALFVYTICFVLLYPLYRYIFDVDGIGYLMVMKRLAGGDYLNAINGFWSPLHSWLALPLYKAGMNEFAAFKTISGIAGAGILIVVTRLMKKIIIADYLKTAILLVCIPIIVSYVFYELAADILFCLLLLIYTDIITTNNFFEKPGKNILCGVVACVSYFAKTYAFPFFLVHFAVVQFLLYRNTTLNNGRILLFRNLLLGFVTFFVIAMPWIYILYYKYHFITFGYSGQLNSIWLLYPYDIPGQVKLQAISPSPLICHWEDPYSYPSNIRPHPSFFSLTVLIKQMRVFLTAFMNMLTCFKEISFISSALVLCLAVYVLKKKNIAYTFMLLVIVILPAGYLLLLIETRYIWTVTFLILITGAAIFAEGLRLAALRKPLQVLCWCIFFGSFLIYPINQLKDTAGRQADDFYLAKELNNNKVKGKFVCNKYNHMTDVSIYAYLTGSTFYHLSRVPENNAELVSACRESAINYFFFYYDDPAELDAFKETVLYKTAVQEIKTKKTNLLLLKLN